VLVEVLQAALHRLRIGLGEGLLRLAAMHLQRADGRHQHHGVRVQARAAALDVEEFLRAQVETEAGLGDRPVRQVQGHAGREHAVAAVRDVGERPAMHQHRRALDGLHQVRVHRVAQQREQGVGDVQRAQVDRLAVVGAADQDAVEALAQVVEVVGQAQDGHDFRGGRDVEAALARNALVAAAEAQHDMPQAAVVHVHDPAPGDHARVDAEVVAPVDVVVDRRGDEVVGRRDGVEVAGEMQVDAVGGFDPRAPAAGRAALDAEAGAERRLAQGDADRVAETAEGLAEADRRGRLALAGAGRRGRRDQHQPGGAFAPTRAGEGVDAHLGDPVAVGHEVTRIDAQPGRGLADRGWRHAGSAGFDGAHYRSPGRRLSASARR